MIISPNVRTRELETEVRMEGRSGDWKNLKKEGNGRIWQLKRYQNWQSTDGSYRMHSRKDLGKVGQKDAWYGIDGWTKWLTTDARTYVRRYRQTDRRRDIRTDIWMDRWAKWPTHIRTDGRRDGWRDVCRVGRMDESKDADRLAQW